MSDLEGRLAALGDAVTAATGRLEEDVVGPARAVVDRAGTRLGLGLASTVVALAGPTGAGKSSLFNALVGEEVATAGRRRPTTSAASAALWGEANPALLDWLEVGRRHRAPADPALDGLVLVDLPDFDSVEGAHRTEVDRLVGLVDLVVWVTDPQKYADAAWHDRYLRRLASHSAAMAVVLNQVDLLAAGDRDRARGDLVRLLADDDLPGVPVLAASVRTGEGVDAVRRLVAERVAAREAALVRLDADVDATAAALAASCGPEGARRVDGAARDRLVDALAVAAGAPTVVDAVERAHRRRGVLATGWPFVRWVRRLRPDPLRRLRLPESPQEAVRTSMAPPSPAALAGVENAARALAAGVSDGLPAPWPGLVRDAALGSRDALPDALDRAVAGTDLGVGAPRWWAAAGALQWVFALVVAAGALWLVALAGLRLLRIEDVVPLPEVWGIPVPTALLLGGALAGVVAGFVARLVNGASARRRGRAAGRALRRRVEVVGADLVVAPVEAELDAHDRLARALGSLTRTPTRRQRLRAALS
ncbi:GTPase [Miltoncostaea oceani]|uniref:GTPase n=1 Tax=Miltoncostaea oceani TaxID=2843216 RepID=UPI001C3DC7BC|nr:GTPase [Miltoncostaea oceani]